MNKIFNIPYILEEIIHLNNYNINQYFNLRYVNKLFNSIILDYIQRDFNEDNDYVFNRRTMINTKVCMVCESRKENINFTYFLQDIYPKRIIGFCTNSICYIKAKRYITNSSLKNQNIIYLNKYIKANDKLYIPRSDKSITLAELNKLYFVYFENDIYLSFDFIQNNQSYSKIIPIRELLKVNSDEYILSLIAYIEKNVRPCIFLNKKDRNIILDTLNKTIIACNKDICSYDL
jgi:hypothetical protein